jgi:hypothetical protein
MVARGVFYLIVDSNEYGSSTPAATSKHPVIVR